MNQTYLMTKTYMGLPEDNLKIFFVCSLRILFVPLNLPPNSLTCLCFHLRQCWLRNKEIAEVNSRMREHPMRVKRGKEKVVRNFMKVYQRIVLWRTARKKLLLLPRKNTLQKDIKGWNFLTISDSKFLSGPAFPYSHITFLFLISTHSFISYLLTWCSILEGMDLSFNLVCVWNIYFLAILHGHLKALVSHINLRPQSLTVYSDLYQFSPGENFRYTMSQSPLYNFTKHQNQGNQRKGNGRRVLDQNIIWVQWHESSW